MDTSVKEQNISILKEINRETIDKISSINLKIRELENERESLIQQLVKNTETIKVFKSPLLIEDGDDSILVIQRKSF